MRKKPTVFASHGDYLYVQVRAIMHPLIPFVDGLAVTTFKGDKKLYMKVDAAIDWCKKEMEFSTDKKLPKTLAALESAKEKFSAGKVEDA